MKTLIQSILICILTLSGCFFSPPEKNGEDEEKLHVLWEYTYDFDGGAPRVRPLLHSNKIITSGDINTTALDYITGELIWKTPFDHHRQLLNSTFGLKDEIIVGSIAQKIIAWNVFSGEELWSMPIDDSLSFNNSRGIGVIPDGFVAVSNGPMVYRIDKGGNMEIINTDARSYEATFQDGVLYIGQVKDMEGVVSAYDIFTFELIWRFNPKGFAYPAYTAPIIENNTIYRYYHWPDRLQKRFLRPGCTNG